MDEEYYLLNANILDDIDDNANGLSKKDPALLICNTALNVHLPEPVLRVDSFLNDPHQWRRSPAAFTEQTECIPKYFKPGEYPHFVIRVIMEDYDYLFKIVLIGNAGVGKTCLVRRFTQGLFPPGQGATIGVDFMIKTVEIKGEKVKLQIWDTAGQERFRSITQSYYRSANALILTYDITCEDSFRCLPEWLREIEQYANTTVVTILVGNKIDLAEKREVLRQRAEEFADSQSMLYLETSAKESDNVEKLFLDLACKLIREAKQNTLDNNDTTDSMPGEGKAISYLGCCNTN
ncbi:hypothetical protein DPEC_G00297620 [Dallia pectoralis]|uniref:Uncharacterized protein n=1 Tax=Dallia pectoralis TaxID=75939 RepID=A0ACC2FFQ1_DALPE|nr:hypothetical protein DPEC_G00297620 [Dallia pectoralis]